MTLVLALLVLALLSLGLLCLGVAGLALTILLRISSGVLWLALKLIEAIQKPKDDDIIVRINIIDDEAAMKDVTPPKKITLLEGPARECPGTAQRAGRGGSETTARI
jgi:hypothetical protein